MTPTVPIHPPGIYLGLAERAYQADASLGYTSMKLLKNDPFEFWERSAWNPNRPPPSEDEKKAFLLGTAYHVLQLEGLDIYDMAYGIAPTPADYPEAIDTIRDLQRELRLRGQPVSGQKSELVQRLHSVAPDLEILELLMEQFREQAKRPISRRDDSILRRLYAMAMAAPDDIKLLHGEVTTLRQAFTGGLSEVSVFWVDDNDIPMRARFDKLKPNSTIDLKTISKWDDSKDFERTLLKEIKHRDYWMQVAHYHEARHQLRRLAAEGLIYGGTEADRNYLMEVAEADEWTWVWIFAKVTGAPRLKAIPGHADNLRFTRAQQGREEAIGKFIINRAQFGLEYGYPWIDTNMIWDPSEDEWGQADFI